MSAKRRTLRPLEPGRLVWRDWGNESVVFDRLSGETHLLDVVSAAAVKYLERKQQPVDSAEMHAAIANSLDVPADGELQRFLDQLVDHSISLGLLEEEP